MKRIIYRRPDASTYRVYMVNFPPGIRAATRISEDGFASIYLNDNLSDAAKQRALDHEFRHIDRGDFYSDRPIEEIES